MRGIERLVKEVAAVAAVAVAAAAVAGKEIMGKTVLWENRGMSVHQTASPQVYLSGSCHC